MFLIHSLIHHYIQTFTIKYKYCYYLILHLYPQKYELKKNNEYEMLRLRSNFRKKINDI